MTKAELTQAIASALRISKRDAKNTLEVIFDSMIRALREGDRVEIRRFGTFHRHYRGARRGRNPRTGARVEISAKAVLSFRPSREVRALARLTRCLLANPRGYRFPKAIRKPSGTGTTDWGTAHH